ncbi:MBL fold metallo-hydrolase [Arsenicicoccus sp. oral taxon 190]|uniref:MBL fold metallo-hydrolase n=1 Tax=Arsenicicoccus sp. oral taxon 190 TaxID=1658671 RepID=UPI000679F669|nr:MBL fold metallo-hydrolase [Arsenicicoccus sp. oral taxon 190]AKT51814.1 hydrolase [Arsenicicoccus sp. oral taxon 190]
MLVLAFPAQAFGTNCYVVAPAAGEQALVVDPGIGVVDQLREVLAEHRLKPAAVLLTHGHLDHVFSVTPVCTTGDDADLAAYIHADDRYRLQDPAASLDPQLVAMFEQQFGAAWTWREPPVVEQVRDHQHLDLAGLGVDVLHAPGHTEGSVMFTLPGAPDGVPVEASSTVLAGDVLFAGSIGRTDLPGGDHDAMMRSLREVVLPLPDDALILPGHGPATTMVRERAANPYLTGL